MLATVAGGGVDGQAGAVRLGIARALVEYNAELRKRLKKGGLLTQGRAREGTQEIRHGGRAQAVPVQQALRRAPAFPTREVIRMLWRQLDPDRDEGFAGSWRALRASDEALEPEDEGIHFRRAQRHLHS